MSRRWTCCDNKRLTSRPAPNNSWRREKCIEELRPCTDELRGRASMAKTFPYRKIFLYIMKWRPDGGIFMILGQTLASAFPIKIATKYMTSSRDTASHNSPLPQMSENRGDD